MAVVVDDHLMKITHIVRGEEWLPSTPKHVYLYEAFGWEKPTYIHLPTVLNKERKKLSKRHGDVAVGDFKEKGYLPEGLVNYLALVGWSPEDNEEILSMDDLIEKFSFERVSKTGGIFDKDKLDWVNGHYIRAESLEHITNLAIPYLVKDNYIDEDFAKNNPQWLEILVDTVRESLDHISEITETVDFIFEEKIKIEGQDLLDMISSEESKLVFKTMVEELKDMDEIDMEFSKSFMKSIQKKTGIKGKKLFMPVRIALTGSEHGPELVNVMYLLGKDKMIASLNNLLS